MIVSFIQRLFFFVLPIVLLACVGDFILSNTLKKSKTIASGEYSTWNDLYDGKINGDVIVYGSSRAVSHFDPFILEDSLHSNCYNLGVDGHNFWMQYFRHTEMLKYNPKPKVIILSLDAATLTEKGNVFNADQFLPYMFFDEAIADYTASYNYFSTFDFHVPLVRYFGNHRAIFHSLKLLFISQPDTLERKKGYRGQRLDWNSDLLEARKILTSYKVDIDEDAVNLFKQFVTECRESGIRLVFVFSPHYIEGQQFIQNYDSIMTMYDDLSTKYNIPFLNYSTDSISSSKKYFYNSSHLNKKGSELFSRKLGHDLKELLN
jgi:hypothetical protein